MKYFFSFILIVSSFSSTYTYASEKEFLKCLGAEEKFYHTNKKGGAYINLNKAIISAFIQMSDTLDMKKSYQEKICRHKNFPPSLATLYYILQYQEKAFISKAEKLDLVQRSKDDKMKTEVITRTFYALTGFIDDLQTQVTKPNCIVKHIPTIKEFYTNSRYTMEDVGIKRLFKSIKNYEQVLIKLHEKKFLAKCTDQSKL